jgi:5-methylcytosine-specific restriction endonuclease McrA
MSANKYIPNPFNNTKYVHISKEKLLELYVNQNMRRYEIADMFGVADVTIKKKLQNFGIKKSFEAECKNKERKVTKQCLECGGDFIVVPFRSHGKWEIKYCCHSCSAKARDLGKKHRTKMRTMRSAKRRVWMKDAQCELTTEEENVIEQLYLKCPDGYEIDHIIPISKGGLHHPDNLQYLTMVENRSKRDKII